MWTPGERAIGSPERLLGKSYSNRGECGGICGKDERVVGANVKMSHLQQVLKCIQDTGLTINPKCAVAKKEVEYLGYVIGFGKIKPQVGKVEAIQTFPGPTSKKKMSFMVYVVQEAHSPLCTALSSIKKPAKTLSTQQNVLER